MITDIITIKQELNRKFYTSEIMEEIKRDIESELDAKVDIIGGQIHFRISKKTAKANGFKFDDSTSVYKYIEEELIHIYYGYAKEIRDLNLDIYTIESNISFLYRLNAISGNTFVLEL